MKSANHIRLFVDAHVFDEEFQGTRTFIKEIYSVLAQKKNIFLYLGAYNVDNLKKYFPAAANVFFIKYKSTSGLVRLIYDIPAIIKGYGIEYAHFQYITPPFKNCKFIVTIHDVIFSEYPREFSLSYRLSKRFLYRTSALKADIVTTVSEYSKKSIQKYLSINKENIHVIPNGVSVKYFDDYNKEDAQNFIKNKYGFEKFILFVSRIEPRKNHLFLLRAYLQLKLYSRGYYLVLLGNKTMKVPQFDEVLGKLPLKIRQYIFISGEINDDDLLQFYRAATAFVYPSKGEGFGIPPLEAAALQIPVICSNSSAMSNYSFFGDDHIDPLNYELFKTRLAYVVDKIGDETYTNNLSEIIRKEYSWTESAEKLYQVIVNDHSN